MGNLVTLFFSHQPTAVTCGELQDPENGRVSINSDIFDSLALYTCDSGYMISGEVLRRCQANAMWSGEAPMCPRMLC